MQQAITPASPGSGPSRTIAYRAVSRHADLLWVVAVALSLRLLFALLTADTYDYDEFVILLLGRDTAHGAVPYRDFMFFHPPGILELFRLIEPITRVWWPSGRIAVLLLDSLTAGCVWAIANRLWDRRGALCAGLLYAANPLALISAVRVGQDPVMTLLGTTGLLLLVRYRSAWSAVPAGICLGLAVWVKYPGLIFFPAYLVASRHRSPLVLLAAIGCVALCLFPFWGQHQLLYDQTIAFQRSRWLMDPVQRAETIAIFWLAVNVFAVWGAFTLRAPLWLLLGFACGVIFVGSSQVYYHYFVPLVPFGALLGGPVIAQLSRQRVLPVAGAALAFIVAWGCLIDRGGVSPLYVTAAHLSTIKPTIQILDATTNRSAAILSDRFEYPYLADRRALAHYFWNIGVLINARYLEDQVGRAGAVVMSYGASSGYPAGFVRYLDEHYRRVNTGSTTVWLPREREHR